jgi:hypothetical protein
MDDELKFVVATPFKKKAATSLSIKDFEFALSFDLKWMAPPLASKARDRAISTGLLRLEGNRLVPTFDIAQTEMPNGFKPSGDLFAEKALIEEIISLISARTGKSEKEVIALVNNRQEQMGDLVEIEIAGLIIAKDTGCDTESIYEKIYLKMFKGP